MRFRLLVPLFALAGACTSILDFDGYEYVEPGSGGASASATTNASSGTQTSASAGGAGGMSSSDTTSSSTGGLKPLGEPCNDDIECESNDCQNNVCCNDECEGECEACDQSGFLGYCTNLPAGDPGDCLQGYICDGMGNCMPNN